MTSKKSSAMKSTFHIYLVFFSMLLILITVCVSFFFYIVKIQKPNGDTATSAWPKTFTEQFSEYIFLKDNLPQIRSNGIDLLRQYDLWVQILDENGNEILNYGTDADTKSSYSTMDLLNIASGKNNDEETIFIGTYSDENTQWNYLIGFPINITKVSMYMNGDHFTSGKRVVVPILFGSFIFTLFAGFIYGLWITKKMRKITKSVVEIASRTYLPIEKSGVFSDVYESLNCLDNEIRLSDSMKENTERMREEWIANITHDLKTPLSPIKGYAELLSDSQYEINSEDVRRYGCLIQKNTNYVEDIINDLKLIYQIDNGMIPIHMSEENISRQLKEIVIDLLNNPEYAERDIEYTSDENDIYMKLDITLFHRAMNNLIINAMVHNTLDTKISISIKKIERMNSNDEISIRVRDNGKGLTEEEQDNLFSRYYRGTNTEMETEGTGLGMAIVKQIVELHDGKINIESVKNEGTSILVSFPLID